MELKVPEWSRNLELNPRAILYWLFPILLIQGLYLLGVLAEMSVYFDLHPLSFLEVLARIFSLSNYSKNHPHSGVGELLFIFFTLSTGYCLVYEWRHLLGLRIVALAVSLLLLTLDFKGFVWLFFFVYAPLGIVEMVLGNWDGEAYNEGHIYFVAVGWWLRLITVHISCSLIWQGIAGSQREVVNGNGTLLVIRLINDSFLCIGAFMMMVTAANFLEASNWGWNYSLVLLNSILYIISAILVDRQLQRASHKHVLTDSD